MQEHPLYKTTPEQGWAQMQTILDKAMPAEYRSRRVVAFWLAAALAILLGVSSVILLTGKSRQNNLQQNETPSMEMTNNENLNAAEYNQSLTTSSSDKVNGELQGEANGNKENPKKTEIIASNASSPVHPSKTISSAKSKLNTELTQNNSLTSGASQTSTGSQARLTSDDLQANIVDVADSKEMSRTEDNEQNSSTSVEVSAMQRNITSVEFLPVTDVWDYETVQYSIGHVEPGNRLSSRRLKAFSPNVSIAGMAGSQNGLGINAAIGTDYNITSRLSLTGNVGYRIYNPDAFHLGNASKDALNAESTALLSSDLAYAGIENYIVGERVNAAADYNALNPFVQSIHQWQISAGLKYKITKRFFLEGGIGLGFDTKANSEYPIATFGSIVSVPDANFKNTFDSYDVIRSNMTSAYGGLGYKLNRHLDIHAQWTYGLDHYLLNDQATTMDSSPKRSDYIRGLNAGVRYSL